MFRQLKINQKIGFGYAVSLMVAVVGTAVGTFVGDRYHHQAVIQYEDTLEELLLIRQLETNLLSAQIHYQVLSTLLSQPADFQEEYEELKDYAESSHQLWIRLHTSYVHPEAREFNDEIAIFQHLSQRYGLVTEHYLQEVEGLVFDPNQSQRSSVQMEGLRSRLTQFQQSNTYQQFHQLSEALQPLLAVVSTENEESQKLQEQAEVLRIGVTLSSLVLSVGIAIVLSIQTSRAISHPIQEASELAQQVTKEQNFDLQIPVTTQDEVGELTQSLNALIQKVKTLLVERRAAELKLVQSEKMSSLGQLVAGVAHEINNPVNFIHGNLAHANDYTQDLIGLIQLYQQHYPHPHPEIEAKIDEIDLAFLAEDLAKLQQSMQVGTTRIRDIVLSLRNFSRLDEAVSKEADLHEGLDSTLMILGHRLKAKPDQPTIKLVKDYGALPKVDCYPGQLNQVFMNLLTNAIDALEEHFAKRGPTSPDNASDPTVPMITIQTLMLSNQWVAIHISDNGPGIPEALFPQLFDPFFTTKPVGKGTGLGLSISYQIITETHGGHLRCESVLGKGASFVIELPIKQSQQQLANSVRQLAIADGGLID